MHVGSASVASAKRHEEMYDLIIGPSSVGKSTFYDALTRGLFRGYKPGPLVFAHSVGRRIPKDAVLHYNMLKPLLHVSQKDDKRPFPPEEYDFFADPVFSGVIRNPKRIRKLWVLVCGREELLNRIAGRKQVERTSPDVYNSQYWGGSTARLDLFRLYEDLFDILEAAKIPYDVIYSSAHLADGFATSDRVFCHHNLRGRWLPTPCREEIDAVSRTEGCEYQTVRLPAAVMTAQGNYDHLRGGRELTFKKLFTTSIHNRSVLDIGCANGELLYKAERLGASRLVGVDLNRERFQAAVAIAALIQSRVQLNNIDFADFTEDEPFDFVFALNVLHHVEDVCGFLRKATSLTRCALFVEFPTLRDVKFARHRWPLPGWLLNRASLMGVSSRSIGQTFVFSPPALVRLLSEEIGGFSSWNLQKSPIKGRCIGVFIR